MAFNKGMRMEQKGVYNRLFVIMAYLFLVGWVAFLAATNDNLTFSMAEKFLTGAVFPVLGYVLIKGQNTTKPEPQNEPIADE